MCVIHVEVGEAPLHLRERRGGEAESPGAWGGSSQLAGAAQCGVGWDEGVEEGALVVLDGVADEGAPVVVAEALAHAEVVPDAGARLREQGRPALGGTVAAQLADCLRGGARDFGCAAMEVEERCVRHGLCEEASPD